MQKYTKMYNDHVFVVFRSIIRKYVCVYMDIMNTIENLMNRRLLEPTEKQNNKMHTHLSHEKTQAGIFLVVLFLSFKLIQMNDSLNGLTGWINFYTSRMIADK